MSTFCERLRGNIAFESAVNALMFVTEFVQRSTLITAEGHHVSAEGEGARLNDVLKLDRTRTKGRIMIM